MVAMSGSGWRLAPALRLLIEQIDAAYPDRPKGSDGSIGDTAHADRKSDHNPSGGLVLAIDITDWPGGAFDPDDWARTWASRDPRVKYLISDGQIWSAARAAEGWRPYTGSNAHAQHMHVSVTSAGANNVAPWAGITRPAPAPPTPLPVNITTKGEFMASLYYRHTGDGRIARDSGGMWVHLTSAEFDADQAVARAVTGQPITLVPVYPIVWDNLATSRLNVKAMNRAASRAR